MKPIILLGIVAVAAITLSAGSLTNVITLDVQQFGVGEETILSPIDDATVKFDIQKILGSGGAFKNYISDCFISSPDQIDAGSKIFCKLTDINGDIVAEGSVVVPNTISPNTPITVPIDDPDVLNSLVQNIHDVIVVVQGPKV